MFNFFSKLFGIGRRRLNIVVLGLNNSGKSTLISHLKPARADVDVHEVVPTVGFSTETFSRGTVDFTIFDMSGDSKYRGLWESKS